MKTDDLMNSLRSASSVENYLGNNEPHLITASVASLLEQWCDRKGVTKASVIHGAELNEIYGYQIFAGTRVPSRDKLICLGLSLQLNEDELQSLLKAAGMAPLYPKRKRDSIVLFGVMHGQSVWQINQALFDAGEETL
ncbi:MAG: XRE family transcriptional regulator [Clostridia bacterium]|nr:XRE family transcriptional regulator [Clostridia bacterium]